MDSDTGILRYVHVNEDGRAEWRTVVMEEPDVRDEGGKHFTWKSYMQDLDEMLKVGGVRGPAVDAEELRRSRRTHRLGLLVQPRKHDLFNVQSLFLKSFRPFYRL